MADTRIKPDQVAALQNKVDDGALSSTMAKTVFEKMFETGRSADDIARSEGLTQISDTDAVSAAVEQAIADNPDPVRDYLGGKQQAMGFLVGQVMKPPGARPTRAWRANWSKRSWRRCADTGKTNKRRRSESHGRWS